MNIKTIYLAGKMDSFEAYGWRSPILTPVVPNLPMEYLEQKYIGATYEDCAWPIAPQAVLGKYDYVGPWFVGDNKWQNDVADLNIRRYRYIVHKLSLNSLKKADFVFAWVDNPTAYGTFVELSVASALGKPIAIAGPGWIDDLWFIYDTCGMFNRFYEKISPKEMLESLLAIYDQTKQEQIAIRHFSPIELLFWEAWQANPTEPLLKLTPQAENFNFAHLPSKLGIIIGEATPDILSGWQVKRFSCEETYKATDECVLEAQQFILKSL